MCTAGRIQFHLQNNLYRSESSVIFVGFQAEGTLGRRIVDGAKQVKIYGEDIAVKAQIHTLGGFSAHADRDALLEWLDTNNNPDAKVFVVHGEAESSESFAGYIHSKLGLKTHVPSWGEIVDIETMQSEFADYGTPTEEKFSSVDKQIEALTSNLKLLTEKYNKTKAENKLDSLKRLKDDINDVKVMIAAIIDKL
jgi:metallo-beta-lactamase family protein